MDIRTLEAFLSLANYLNFTKSAEQLYISQPAFSRQITRLEEEFGCSLFYRNKRKVELTEYGRAFVDYAERMSSEYNKWMIELKQMQSSKTGHLRIGFLQDFPHGFLPKMIKFFSSNHSNIQLSMNDKGTGDIVDGLLRGELDFGFSLSNDTEYEDIETLVVAKSPLCVAMPKNHRLAEKSSLAMENLADERFIMISPDIYAPSHRHILNLCKLGGFEPNIISYCNFVPSMLTLVKCGAGIALVASDAQYLAAEDLNFIPIDNDSAKVCIILLWKKTNKNPAVPIFLETARLLLDEEE